MTRLGLADFEPCLNEPFQIHYGNDETLVVTLVELRPWGPPPPAPPPADYYQPFAAVFQSTITAYLPQGTYMISNDRMGTHPIFIVPHAPNTTGIQYEATFS